MNQEPTISTLGQLKQSGYKPKSIRQELRDNLIERLRSGQPTFKGIFGYDETVIPELERAILSMHHINLLGLRGQAKTRIARSMTGLLDEYIPILKGSELNDDPLNPISFFGKQLVKELGDEAPVAWLHRSERYTEKLATPDVSVSDLIGDADPIKAATLKLPYSDERVIHFGLIPRANRGIFVINELPDLQARIQVALFNILQEGDIQIRGFKIRLPLDVQFVFTANPEDYTNRGSIVTPLKDRIGSQIITHYPGAIQISRQITQQEAQWKRDSLNDNLHIPDLAFDLVEMIGYEARKSEFVDAKSGVSARLSISALENLVSAAERRLLKNNEKSGTVRVADFVGVIPAITGKIELVYEGEQEGAATVASNLIGQGIRTLFTDFFDEPEKAKKRKDQNPYARVLAWFGAGNEIDLLNDLSEKAYRNLLDSVPGLKEIVQQVESKIPEGELYFFMEFLLHGLAEYSAISKRQLDNTTKFKDLFSTMFDINNLNEFDFDSEADDEEEDK